MIKRLRAKFILVNMLIVVAMLCVIFFLMLHFTRLNLETENISQMRTEALEIINSLQPGQQLDEIRTPWFIIQVGIQDEVEAFAGYYAEGLTEEALTEILQEVVQNGDQTGLIESGNLRYCWLTVQGIRYVIFSDTQTEESAMEALMESFLLIGVVSLAAFLVISILLSRWAIRPVEKAWEQQRQFVADASHELKTPLTVILTSAELLQDPEQDPDSCRRLSENILTMARQMRGLLEGMLDLARMDAGMAVTEPVQIDLSRLVSDAVLPFEPVFYERGMTLESQIETGISVQGNPDHLKQVVDILLDNAQKYAVPGAQVDLVLKRQNARSCLLSVKNPGDPISRENLKKIFTRFYREDQARSRDGSYGLGLSIARSIVESHGGHIWAESTEGYNIFSVRLPCRYGIPAPAEKRP